MNDLNKLRELKQLDTIILKYLDDSFSNNNTEWVGEIEKVGLTVVEYKNTIYNSLKDIIDKYKDDFSYDTHYNLIELPNDERYNIDVLVDNYVESILNQFKEKYNVNDEFCDFEYDWMICDNLIHNLLYYFRLFYEKWYLQSRIDREIDNLIKFE